MRFHGLALHCPTPGVLGKRSRTALRRIAWFYSRNFADRRTDREKFDACVCAWNGLTEAFTHGTVSTRRLPNFCKLPEIFRDLDIQISEFVESILNVNCDKLPRSRNGANHNLFGHYRALIVFVGRSALWRGEISENEQTDFECVSNDAT